jgi:hypothetical protein
MTSADTIGCRLALAREEDGNREWETGLWLGDQLQAFDSSEGRFFSHFYIQTSWFSGIRQKRQKAKN